MTQNQNPFVAAADRYEKNMTFSPCTHARAGILETPDGTQEPGVIIFRNRFCIAVLTPEDAIRLSNELIDQVERPVIQ